MFDVRMLVSMAVAAWVTGCGASVGDEVIGTQGMLAGHDNIDDAGPLTDEAGGDAGTALSSATNSSPTPDSGTTTEDAPGCPPKPPRAGTKCIDPMSICGYGDVCGLTFATCNAGVWEVSASPGCDGGGPPEGA